MEDPEDFFRRAERMENGQSSEQSEDEENNDDDDDDDGLGSIQQSNNKSNQAADISSDKSYITKRHQPRPDRFFVGEGYGRQVQIPL